MKQDSFQKALTLAADGLIAALFTLGQLLPFCLSRGWSVSWASCIGSSLLAVLLVSLLSRRWWLLPGLLILLAAPFSLVLTRLRLWPFLWQKVLGFLIWAEQLLLEGSQAVRPGYWLFLLELLLALLLAAGFFFLVRKIPSSSLAGLILLATFTYYLYFTDLELPALLPGLAGLIALLPASLARQLNKNGSALIRPAAAKWLALPLAALCVLASQQLVPQDTSRWVQKDLLNLLQDWSDFFQADYAAGGLDYFSISVAGYPASSTRLGGPVVLNDQVFLTVNSPRPLLLRGSARSVYTGSSWQSPVRQAYRLGSPLWRLLESQVFLRKLPAGAAGRSLANRYQDKFRIQITPKTRWQTSIFQAGQMLELDFPDRKFHPPFFNWDGDLFVKNSLPADPIYSLTLASYQEDLPGFAHAVAKFWQDFDPAADPFWPFVQDRYLQLPDSLPAFVQQEALAVTSAASDPYAKATLLQDYLLANYSYTLAAKILPEDEDFVNFFLHTGQGYCVHFASAMTVMARTIGLPARYVEGFALKPDKSRPDSYQAVSETAHAWTEIYLAGLGWLVFDATPAAEPEPAPDPGAAEVTISPEPSVTEPAPFEPEETEESTSQLPRLGLYLAGSLVLLSLTLFLLASSLARRHRRRIEPDLFRRLHPQPGPCLLAAGQDIKRQLACWGLVQVKGETLLEFTRRIETDPRLAKLHLSSQFWPILRLIFGQHQPLEQEVVQLLKLRQLLEADLRHDMTWLDWFFKRVLAGSAGKIKR